MKKTNISYLIVAVLIIVGIVSFLFLKKSAGEPSVPLEEDLVTYTTKEYSFSYPKNWFVHDNTDDKDIPYLSVANYDPNLLPPHDGPEDFFKLEIVKLVNQGRLSLQNWVEDFVKSSPTGSSIIDQREGKIDGHKTLFVNQIVGDGPQPGIYIERDGFVYFIQGGSRSPVVQPFFDSFLRSFHFIDSN